VNTFISNVKTAIHGTYHHFQEVPRTLPG